MNQQASAAMFLVPCLALLTWCWHISCILEWHVQFCCWHFKEDVEKLQGVQGGDTNIAQGMEKNIYGEQIWSYLKDDLRQPWLVH